MIDKDSDDKKQKFILCFSAVDNSGQVKGGAEQPVWEGRIDVGLEKVFKFGGRAELSHLRTNENIHVRQLGKIACPNNPYIYALSMVALPGQFRLIALTNDSDYKNDVFVWWEPGERPFRGKIRFGDDEWDARTICTDLEVAVRIFRDMFEHGDLSAANLSEMRSRFNPKPLSYPSSS